MIEIFHHHTYFINKYVIKFFNLSKQRPFITFEFEVDLFKEKKNVDDYYLDFPVAIIKFNEATEVFEYDTKYTKHIKSKITETTGSTSPLSVKVK